MSYEKFEQAVLDVWMTSRVPLTQTNLSFYTGFSHKQVRRHLDEMIKQGLLDFDSDDEGEFLYKVRGSVRPSSGPQTLVRCTSCGKASVQGTRCNRCGQFLDTRLATLSQGATRASSALTLLQQGARGLTQTGQGEKSLVVGAALGLLGPFGWLYAGAWKETIPAAALWVLLCSLPLVKPLLWVLIPILLPVSALIGFAYTASYNRKNQRTTLVLEDSPTSFR